MTSRRTDFVRSRLVGDTTVRQQIQRRNRAHAEEVRSRLINREQIIRGETALASAALLEQGKSVVLEGAAGSGKSCVLVQLMQHLEEQDIPHLVIRLDTLESGDQHAQAIGTRLGLPDSPAITLGGFAGSRPSVLVVDQLDAISVVSAPQPGSRGGPSTSYSMKRGRTRTCGSSSPAAPSTSTAIRDCAGSPKIANGSSAYLSGHSTNK